SIVAPWTIARWPIATRLPMIVGTPWSTWTIVPSCTLLSSPITMRSESPRITAVGQTETRAPSVTSPNTTAAGWMKEVGWRVGTELVGILESVRIVSQPRDLSCDHVGLAKLDGSAAKGNRTSEIGGRTSDWA